MKFQVTLLQKSSVKGGDPVLEQSPEPATDEEMKDDDGEFHKFTPLCGDREKITCMFCENLYETRRSYIVHLHSQHSKHFRMEMIKDVKDAVGTCRHPDKKNSKQECGTKAPLHKMYRHLQDIHGDQKPMKGHQLRGFSISVNKEGDIRTKSVYLPKDAPDPPQAGSSESSDDDNSVHENWDKNSNESFNDESSAESVDLDKSSNEPGYVENNEVSFSDNDGTGSQAEAYDDDQKAVSQETEDEVFETPKLQRDLIDLKKRKLEFDGDSTNPLKKTVVKLDNIGTFELHDLYDSDYEDNDDMQFTMKRMEAKKKRHNLRNQAKSVHITDIEENKLFIEDMKGFMMRRRVSTVNKDNSSIKKHLNYLFFYDDSMLNFEFKKNNLFNLSKLTSFDDSMFLLNDPTDWITTEAQDYGSRGLEMLKSHSELRKYLAYKVDNDQVGVSSEAIEKKNALINALNRITKNVSETGLFRRYTKLYKQQKTEVDIANQILDVEKGQNEVNFVENWNSSNECEKVLAEMEEIFKKYESGVDIGEKEFNQYAEGARFMLAMSDKNRRSVYQFSNQHYTSRQEVFFPSNYNEFDTLPKDWQIHNPPNEDAEPDQWIIRLSGKLHNKKIKDSINWDNYPI